MRILILGAGGMLGHRLVAHLAPRHEVHATWRAEVPRAELAAGGVALAGACGGVDARDVTALRTALERARPQVVVNAVGLVKQRHEASDPVAAIELNALLPHRLAALCAECGARLLHVSTDCVFSGRRGAYREDDEPDPLDLYGRSKLLGEVGAPALTLRTSLVGLERGRGATGLVEWYLAQRGTVRGFARAIYTGVTTAVMARLVERVLVAQPQLAGVWQVASTPISKLSLLRGLHERLPGTAEVVADESFVCDRSLDGSRFAAATGWHAPSWDAMLDELAAEVRTRATAREVA